MTRWCLLKTTGPGVLRGYESTKGRAGGVRKPGKTNRKKWEGISAATVKCFRSFIPYLGIRYF